jgi:DNA (cytosine-5)-methyltransferase 1
VGGLAYYNEHDLYAAHWLGNLIAAGHIAPGIVDTRSIEDVRPSDLAGFTQVHLFAGVGVWSYALRRAGWSEDRQVWSCSCPCQPFSTAGQGAGFADERHLWPAAYHLIEQCRPPVVVGEQVASKDAMPWVDLIHTDLEAVGYTFGAVPFPAASVGAPHIRDRLYWMADANNKGLEGRGAVRQRAGERATGASGMAGGLAHHHSDGQRSNAESRVHDAEHYSQSRGGVERLADAERNDSGREALAAYHEWEATQRPADWPGGCGGASRGLADTELQQRPRSAPSGYDQRGWEQESTAPAGLCGDMRPRPTNGYWADVDWLYCRDDRWRPVEPGTFPLAHGAPSRVGRLRAYGNALNAEAARIFLECVLDVTPY